MLHPFVDVAENLHSELADGGGGGGERSDGVGEHADEQRREAGVLGEGQAREHPVQGVLPLRVSRRRRGGRRLRHLVRLGTVLDSRGRRWSGACLPAQEERGEECGSQIGRAHV